MMIIKKLADCGEWAFWSLVLPLRSIARLFGKPQEPPFAILSIGWTFTYIGLIGCFQELLLEDVFQSSMTLACMLMSSGIFTVIFAPSSCSGQHSLM